MSVRLSDDEKAALDVARAGLKPGDYLRGLIPDITTGGFIPEYVEPVSPNVPAPAVDAAGKIDVPGPPERHLHRYSQREHVGYVQAKMTHRWECVCGAEKVQ